RARVTPKKDNLDKDAICHQCGEVGHWGRNCHLYLAELMKKKKPSQGASTSGIFTIELYSFPNKSWVYDTGCGTHIFNTTQGLRRSKKLRLRALNLYVGNGHRAAVEAIGTFHLCILSGLNKRAKLNLDSTLLWHCRLGHISKKRIEKLQHDGLLKSTDHESFDKCISCLSGKMARKPYSHQVERAKDLLRLIHNDEVENQLSKTIKSLRSDREGEYTSQEFLDHLKERGIIVHHTPLHTPQHNGLFERRNKTLLDMVRSMMSQTTLPKSFWDYALESAAHILNMVPTKKGYEALIKRDTLTKPDKLAPKSINLITQEASGSLEDLKISQDEDTHPSENTSLLHNEDDQETNEPQSDIIPVRRSTRTRHALNRMCLYVDAEEHELGDPTEPVNYKVALLDLKYDKWLATINVEMQSIKDNQVWDLFDLPPNSKTVGSKWLFKKKIDMDGNVHTYKARLVAKGFTQTYGVDYEETFSHVVDIRAIRMSKLPSSMDISLKRPIWCNLKVLSI
ncbi:retrotransposon protein, putative, ty1-copia subclass, partial [Tanacetum coccineum]